MASPKSKLTAIYEAFKKVRFGLEFETCVHIMNNPVYASYSTEDEKIHLKKIQQGIVEFHRCINERMNKAIKTKLILDPKQRNTEYNQWVIMPDTSLECDYAKNTKLKEKYCVIKGKIEEDEKICRKFYFLPVEFISPAVTGIAGLKYLSFFWESIIMGDDMVYSVNKTQGLHTNISIEEFNPVKFIKLWTYFEPVILQFLSSSRKQQIMTMAVPISSNYKNKGNKVLFPSIEYLAKGKLLSISYKKEESTRFEVRIYEGTMNINEILLWTIFCMWMLAYSHVTSEENIPEPLEYPEFLEDKREIQRMLTELCDIVKDKTIIHFILNLYRKNKENDWPDFEYEDTTINLFKNVFNFPPNVLSVIQKLKRKTCTTTMLE